MKVLLNKIKKRKVFQYFNVDSKYYIYYTQILLYSNETHFLSCLTFYNL